MTNLVFGAFGLVLGVAGWLSVRVLRANRRREAEFTNPLTQFGISFDSAGFTITGLHPYSTDCTRILWAEVCRVSAYKHVLFYDCIVCLLITRFDGTDIELSEEMADWEPFCKALPEYLPSCLPMPKLLGQIADPPAKNELFSRVTVLASAAA